MAWLMSKIKKKDKPLTDVRFSNAPGRQNRLEEMGLFTAANPFDELIEKATPETATEENWDLILSITEEVNRDPKNAPKNALLAVRKRLNHRDPHVILLALSVLDSLWSNCSRFRPVVSSNLFYDELYSKATHSSSKIGEKTRQMIRRWVEGECRSDASLSLIITLYKNLTADGYSFDTGDQKSSARSVPSDPNFVSSAEEEADIAKAIAASLADEERRKQRNGSTSQPGFNPTTSSLYGSLTGPSGGATNGNVQHQLPLGAPATERRVRALYDFEAAEENELSFVPGDIVLLLDNSDANWWKGRLRGRDGLFPASFVSFDLDPPRAEQPPAAVASTNGGPSTSLLSKPRIDEDVLLKTIALLEECDPTGERPDPPDLAHLEAASLAQTSLIHARLASIDQQHNTLAKVDMAIRDVLAMYDSAVQQMHWTMAQQQQQQQMHQHQQLQHHQVVPQLPSTPQQQAQPRSAVHGTHPPLVSFSQDRFTCISSNSRQFFP